MEKKISVLKLPSKFMCLFCSLAETDRELTGSVKRDTLENKFYPNLHRSMLVSCQRHPVLIMNTRDLQKNNIYIDFYNFLL